MFLTANGIEAAAEVIGVMLMFANAFVIAIFWRMKGTFVTQEDHEALQLRVDEQSEKIAAVDKAIGTLFTNAEAKALSDKMSRVEALNAQLLGEIPGLRHAITALTNQTNLLIENEISNSRRRT
jgi:hypothetical protein